MSYLVVKAFDRHKAGETLPEPVAIDQERRGNLPDLIKNGYLLEVADKAPTAGKTPTPTLDNMSYRELQRLAKERDIPANQSRDELLDALG